MTNAFQSGPKVQWTSHGSHPKVIPLGDSVVVGTVPGCDLRLPAAGLPPLIFQITKSPSQGFHIKTYSPLCGLTLNQEPLTDAFLKQGDKVQVGEHEFSFSIPSEIMEPSSPTLKEKTKGGKKFLSWLVHKAQKKNALLKTLEANLQEKESSLGQRELELAARESALHSEKGFIEQEIVSLGEKNKKEKAELENSRDDLLLQIQQLVKEKGQLGNIQDLRDSDFARLARFQDMLDRKFQHLRERAKDVDLRSGDLQKASRELELQASSVGSLHQQLKLDQECTQKLQAELQEKSVFAAQKDAALETQISEVWALKKALEKNRKTLIEREGELDQRDIQLVKAESEFQQRLQEIAAESGNLFIEIKNLDSAKATLEAEKLKLVEEQSLLEASREEHRHCGQTLQIRLSEFESKGRELKEKEEQWKNQVLEKENQTMVHLNKEREVEDAGKNLAFVQEALRKRFEEMEASNQGLAEKEQRLVVDLATVEERAREMELEHQNALASLVALKEELEAREKTLESRHEELENRHARHLDEQRGNIQIRDEIFAALEKLDSEKRQLELEKAHNADNTKKTFQQAEDLSRKLGGMDDRIPELESLVEKSLSRLLAARETLREHLQEFHQYSHSAREEMESFHTEASNGERLFRELEARVLQAREDHRLSVASFKQNLLEWQHKVGEIKLNLRSGEESLERKNAQFLFREKEMLQQKEILAKKEEILRQDQDTIRAGQEAVHLHLEEMQEWYRKKIRQLSTQAALNIGLYNPERASNALQSREGPGMEAGEPGDRKLGQQLLKLGLIDSATLESLLRASCNQRKSFRNLLLNGGFLTFYQLALIEAGNLDGLMIDRFRVIDRLQSNPREVRYRVFDPVLQKEVLFRQLSEQEMEDPCHPDEYRQQFRAALTIRNENVVQTLEVLDIKGVPSVLAEIADGCQPEDWSFLGRNISAWMQIVWQAIHGLDAIHATGLSYGPLAPSSLTLESSGMLKWNGAGCPTWVLAGHATAAYSRKTDIQSLARAALSWIQEDNGSTEFAGNIHPEKTKDYLLWLEGAVKQSLDITLLDWKEKTAEVIKNLPNLDDEYLEFIRETFNKSGAHKARLSA
ncbi:MAG: hypothetical protein EXR99_02425 [Gemmataceae bacterium]|nr:hypothetical protein [Gemmataceae bacterium]